MLFRSSAGNLRRPGCACRFWLPLLEVKRLRFTQASSSMPPLGDPVVGAASMYNPFKPGKEEGRSEHSLRERYDPPVWAAAIKTNLRPPKFGGVQFECEAEVCLVEAVGKKVIVKINDVGPLRPGRIIDFNERTMRHFDPSLSSESLLT